MATRHSNLLSAHKHLTGRAQTFDWARTNTCVGPVKQSTESIQDQLHLDSGATGSASSDDCCESLSSSPFLLLSLSPIKVNDIQLKSMPKKDLYVG